MDHNTTVDRRSQLEQSDLRDGVALFDPDAQAVHHLNAVAALVWELSDNSSLGSISATVQSILEISPEQALQYTTDALQALLERGLIDLT